MYNPDAKGMMRSGEYVRRCLKGYDLPLMNGPLFVIAHYRIPAPKSNREWLRTEKHLFPHTKRPDGDNLEKFLNDALNGIVWSDDARICWLLRSKTLTDAHEGETILFIRELENDIPNYALMMADIAEHITIEAYDDEAAE